VTTRKRSRAKQEQPASTADSVFLNLPYGAEYTDLLLAYIAGLVVLGLVPHAALEDAGSTRRLNRIQKMIRSCASSIHDLSFLAHPDKKRPHRLNMPFELGMAVAEDVDCKQRHRWYIFVPELKIYKEALSDLDGSDVQIHGGSPARVFGRLLNCFERQNSITSIEPMQRVFRNLKNAVPLLLEQTGAEPVFDASVFRQLCTLASNWTVLNAMSDGVAAGSRK
jgi:hypothetical protein